MHNTDRPRCRWVTDDLLLQYHDTVYGRRRSTDRELFAKLCLEGFQAGLSWRTVLAKQTALYAAFAEFDINACAELSDIYLESQMQNAAIIRNRRKIYAVRQNARAMLQHFSRPGSFLTLTYSGITPDALSKQLKKLGFCFCGPTICESYLMSVGAIEAHEPHCYLYGTQHA